MNETILTSDDFDMIEPKAALIVFQSSAKSYLELRPIRKDGSMASASPVSKEFIQILLSSFSEEYRSIPYGEIPETLLYCDTRRGNNAYVWYNPPMVRNRYFSAKLGLEDGQYHVPGTLYVVKDGRLSVYCFKGNKPKADETLLGVPYFNIYNDGSVCMGSSRPDIPDTDKLSYLDIMRAWENAFWNSIDVHTNGSPSTKENLIETIKKYKSVKFNTSELETRKDRLTINEIIRKLKL